MNIFGVGGHAKVVIDAALKSKIKITAVYDDDSTTHGSNFSGFKVQGSIHKPHSGNAIIAIGNNLVRHNISKKALNAKWQTIIHPNTIIAEDVEIGEGSVIMAGVIIQPGTKIGKHCIVNTGACIDHDCNIGDFVHIAPNCGIAGGVSIGEGALIGIGSSVVQYISIGVWTIIGAGSSVVNDIPSNCTAVGVPAKPIKYNND